MTAGRELDALVAEKVMGLLFVMIDPSDGEPLYRATGGALSWNFVPAYSTSIAAAWTVVEKLSDKWNAQVNSGADGEDLWECSFYGAGGVGPSATADTAPLAICLAALKAVNVEVLS